MSVFHLQIVTPDGLAFDGDAVSIVMRTTSGDVGIMRGHIDYMGSVKHGRVKITDLNGTREAECEKGFLSVNGEITRLVTDGFRWI